MTGTNKILVAVIVIMMAIVVWLSFHLAQLQQHYVAETIRLELALSECTVKERDAAKAIERQNSAIEAVRVDTVVVEKRINNVIDKYSYVRETVRLSVEKDGTCENKINNIDYVLRRFGGAELRPAYSD